MTQAESKASELALQLKDLKAQKAAAESRNVVLEKVFELQGSHSTDKARHDAARATSVTSACSDQASTSGSSEPVPYGLCTQIYSPIDIDTMLEARSEAPLIQFSQAQLKALDWVDFVRLWKEYISRYLSTCQVRACNAHPCYLLHVVCAPQAMAPCFTNQAYSTWFAGWQCALSKLTETMTALLASERRASWKS